MSLIKKYLPKSLFGRSLLIIILPIAIMQIVVAYIFFNAHWSQVSENLSDSVAGDVALVVDLYKQAPEERRAEALDIMIQPTLAMSVAFKEGEALPSTTRKNFFSALDRRLRRALGNRVDEQVWFDTTRYPNYIDIRVQVDTGVLRFITARERVFAPTGLGFVFWLFLATVLLTLVSVLFIRNQARPIARLAAAADAFGKGQDISGYKPTGASEVRLAGHSFLKMRQRLKRHIDQRTTFLAGVSHDLRTPLTRLKLHMALQEPNAENDAAKNDIKDMESMLDAYLDFARGLEGENSEQTALHSYLSAFVSSVSNEAVTLVGDSELSTQLKPVAFKRALQNLVGNSLKYADKVEISTAQSTTHIMINIDDDGPGIAEEQLDVALQPFTRLDTSRNQNIEGVGLGLSIAKDIIQSHGGRLALLKSDTLGGLRAIISLPR